ncbi:MAG: hypothetical protein M3217_03460, partial [Actinomycetota bacterium]|nr:hypothetical protein [Actinomycetota bacterium]
MAFRTGTALRAVAVVSLVSALLPAGPAASGRLQSAQPGDCFGQDPTIEGTAGDDVIRGTRGFDVISSLEGNDVVHAGAGTDFVCTGDGDDRVYGGPGFDLLQASRGADKVYGQGSDDFLIEADTPEDPQGPVWVHLGDSSEDEFHGGPGNDLLTEDGANDLLDGGDGRDTYFGILNFSPIVVD